MLYGLALPVAMAASQIGFGASPYGTDYESLAEAIDERFAISLVASLVGAAAAAAYIVMVRQLSSRHRQLTGESAQPA